MKRRIRSVSGEKDWNDLVLSVLFVIAMTAGHASQSAGFVSRQSNLDESDIDRLEKELADPPTLYSLSRSVTNAPTYRRRRTDPSFGD